MLVHTHHQIVPVNNDKMELMCFVCGPAPHQIAVADRDGNGWVISAEGAETRNAATRSDAIDAMIDMALEVLPDSGYSCTVPHGLRQMP